MKTMRFILSLTILLLSAWTLSAQRGEKIEALRIAFITNKLALTSTESEKFWPIYNVYKNALADTRRQANLDMNLEAMSDA